MFLKEKNFKSQKIDKTHSKTPPFAPPCTAMGDGISTSVKGVRLSKDYIPGAGLCVPHGGKSVKRGADEPPFSRRATVGSG